MDSSAQQVQRLEKGRADLTHDWMKRIAAALGCEPWELLDPESVGPYQEERALRHSRANRIREFRLRNGLSQERLAETVGCGHQQIYKLETGKVDLSHRWMKRLAPALGCEPWELLDVGGGGLSDEERDLLSSFRVLPPEERQALHAYFLAGHENNILARYSCLTKADREIVDWFLFGQTARQP
jgi:transcriptional regulator with XRE-family HTH domain